MADISKLEETGKPIDEQCIRVGAECSRPKCKDCVHYDVCYELTYHEPNGEIVGREVCNNFKDKSRFVELPCNVGDIVWVINKNEIYKCRVYGISIDFKSAWFTFLYNGYFPEFKEKKIYYLSEFSKTVFLTREEAEKALKERNKK